MSTSGYDSSAFAGDALTAAQGALPFIGGGVVAGFAILAITLGTRVGLKALRSVGK